MPIKINQKNAGDRVVVISSDRSWFNLNLSSIWDYKDLILLLVYRDFVATYKQTVLGPLWLILQPVLTTLVMTFVFSNVMNVPTGGPPAILFYLAGITCWGYFSECFNKSATTLIDNAALFGKVYFPRIVVQFSIAIAGFLKFGIQLFILIIVLLLYPKANHSGLNSTIVFLPLLLVAMAATSIGLGMLFSAMSTKYRDLRHLLIFGVQLLMYTTPVIYPLSVVPDKFHNLMALNPMVSIVEGFRVITLGSGTLTGPMVGISLLVVTMLTILGAILFSRVERTFIDSV